jgi:hypothetical protein
VAIWVSAFFSLCLTASGMFIAYHSYNYCAIDDDGCSILRSTVQLIPINSTALLLLLPRLALAIVVTFCTESFGFVHGTSLRSSLASESRLRFNTNIRLLSGARTNRWTNPNGPIFNFIMAILLILSYIASSLAFFTVPLGADSSASSQSLNIYAVPLIILGCALLVQAAISIASIRTTKILTWSSSPLIMTTALLRNGQIAHRSGRCMVDVVHVDSPMVGPRIPSYREPSVWQADKRAKRVIILQWVLIPLYVIWGVSVWISGNKLDPGSAAGCQWSLQGFWCPGVWLPTSWPAILFIFALLQSPLTLSLHCSELICNIVQDEWAWRAATSKAGTQSKNALLAMFGCWPKVGLLIAKPILRQSLLFGYYNSLSQIQTGCLVFAISQFKTLDYLVMRHSLALCLQFRLVDQSCPITLLSYTVWYYRFSTFHWFYLCSPLLLLMLDSSIQRDHNLLHMEICRHLQILWMIGCPQCGGATRQMEYQFTMQVCVLANTSISYL